MLSVGYQTQNVLSQPEIVLELLDDAVTLTRGVLEFPAIHNLHCASHVFYDSFFLQDRRRQAHRGSVRTHHRRNEIVRDRKYPQIHPVLRHQQPPRQTLLYIVQSIARRRLCHLHSLQPTMPAQDHLQLRSRLQNSFQRAPNHSEAIAGDLDYFTHRTSAQANCQSSPNIALAPHYAHFHRSAVLGHHHLGNHSSVGKIDELDALCRLMKAQAIRQIDVRQVSTHQLVFVIGRCQQYFVRYVLALNVGPFTCVLDPKVFPTHGKSPTATKGGVFTV